MSLPEEEYKKPAGQAEEDAEALFRRDAEGKGDDGDGGEECVSAALPDGVHEEEGEGGADHAYGGVGDALCFHHLREKYEVDPEDEVTPSQGAWESAQDEPEHGRAEEPGGEPGDVVGGDPWEMEGSAEQVGNVEQERAVGVFEVAIGTQALGEHVQAVEIVERLCAEAVGDAVVELCPGEECHVEEA